MSDIESDFWEELKKLRAKFPMVYLEAWTPGDFTGDESEVDWTDGNHLVTVENLTDRFDASIGTNWDAVEEAKKQREG